MKKRMEEVFGTTKPIIGMVHLMGIDREDTLENAIWEIEMMYRNGVTAVLVENYFGDAADVRNCLAWLKENHPDRVYGVNLLGNPQWAFEMARAYGAAFVQVDSVCGHLRPAEDAIYARKLAAMRGTGDIFLLGGVRFKYQPYLSGRSLQEDLQLGMERCDAIVVTGEGTGIGTDLEKIKTFRNHLGQFPLIVGAGITAETVTEQLRIADGGIVGSYFKADGRAENTMEERRIAAFMQAANL